MVVYLAPIIGNRHLYKISLVACWQNKPSPSYMSREKCGDIHYRGRTWARTQIQQGMLCFNVTSISSMN